MNLKVLWISGAAALALSACGSGENSVGEPSVPERGASEPQTTPSPSEIQEESSAARAQEPVEAVVNYADFVGDPDAGKRVFLQCSACHTIEENKNRVGPSLYGLVGRAAGSLEGFNYSKANAEADYIWTEETLFVYLKSPQKFMPGTRMAFGGVKNPQNRADLIAYIKSVSP